MQELIFEAYETTPSADPARLAAIEYRLPARQQQKVTSTPKRTPWWVIGLTLMAGTAAAWWAIENMSTPVSDQLTDEIIMSPAPLKHPAVSGQSGKSASSEEHNTAEHPVNNTSDSHESAHDNKTGRVERKDSSVIYRREVF